ncbi:anti-sigma regulatory factor [Vibrio penaeicida]|uniref:Serine/threonine-protein kinase RsbT n=2 Tax=Vibrio penaeicida TaxID=104609 RepID=A0AAV5NY01_9VIBR|nr:anti-sigma regulatory factor [Vibrio penaeicida]RTZ24392.1 anti-sigma regulatory factor [Vibrio penaeicida]GLQ75576.1 serine/threonine-protein kinase RsbT [Vibrio penaeicida]
MQSLTRPNNTLGEEMYSVSSESEVMTVVMASFVLAKEIGFNAVEVNEVSTSVSELAMNIVKYAQKGNIYLHRIMTSTKTGIEIRAEDQGKGIEDIERALRDSESTSGTLGLGLPGVKRMMDEFYIESSPAGTQVVARKWLI